MDCPKCGLLNSEVAQRCDCGYDFATKSMKESISQKAEMEYSRKRSENMGVESPNSDKMKISFIGCVLCGIFGFLSSQYFPIFGGFEKIGEPFSDARLSLVPVHLISGLLAGFFVPFIIISLNKK